MVHGPLAGRFVSTNNRGDHMNRLYAAAWAAVGLFALSGCQKATDSAAFEKQAKEDVRKFIPAFNTGDADTILSHESSQALYDRALEPKTLRLFPAVGHLLNEVSDEVFVTVSEWLMAHA